MRNQRGLAPLQPSTLSTDSLQVSTSSSGSLGKQHNLPLKRASKDLSLAQLSVSSTAPENNTYRPNFTFILYDMSSVDTQFNGESNWEEPNINTNTDTKQSETYSERKRPWYFPHGCGKLLPAENGKGPIIKYAVTHFIAISSSSTKGDRDKILPGWRWGCDCLETRESSDWTNLNDPHPARMEYMEICMQSAVVGRVRASFHVCRTSRKRESGHD